MASSKNYSAEVVLTMNAKQAKQELNGLRSKLDEVEHAMDGMRAAGKQNTDEFKKMAKEQKQFKSAVSQLEGQLITVEQVMNNLGRVSLNQMEKAYRALTQRVKNNTQATAELREQMSKDIASMRILEKEIAKTSGMWKTHEGAINSVIKRLAAYVSVYGAFNLIKGKVTELVKENLAFSDSLADIRKVTGFTTTSLKELSDALTGMDTRTTTEDLHQLAYEAGKLGMGAYGVEGIQGFVKAANQIKIALGEHLGEEAVQELTKIANVLGLFEKYSVEDSLLKVGSVINDLAQSSVATGSYISDFSGRLAGLAKTVGITTGELMGFAAGAEVSKIETEVGATAISKFIVQLKNKNETVAKAVGLDAQYLRDLMDQGRMMDAMLAVLDRLSTMDMSVAADILGDLGSNGQRMVTVFTSLAKNMDDVRRNVEVANAAFDKGVSLTNEYNLKNENAAAILARTKNSWREMFVNYDAQETLKGFAQEWYDLSYRLQHDQAAIWTVKKTLDALLGTISLLAKHIPLIVGILTGLAFNKMLTTLTKTIPWFANFGKNMTLAWEKASVAINKFAAHLGIAELRTRSLIQSEAELTREMKVQNAVQMANAWIAVASAIAGLIIWIGSLVKKNKELSLSMQSVADTEADFETETLKAKRATAELFAELRRTEEGSVERQKLIGEINKEYAPYLENLLSETASLDEIAAAQNRVNEAMREELALRAKKEVYDKVENSGVKEQAGSLYNFRKAIIDETDDADTALAAQDRLIAKAREFAEQYKSLGEDAVKRFKGGVLMGPLVDEIFGVGRRAEIPHKAVVAMAEYIESVVDEAAAKFMADEKYDPFIKGLFTEDNSRETFVTEPESEGGGKLSKQAQKANKNLKSMVDALNAYYDERKQAINQAYLDEKINSERHEKEMTDAEVEALRARALLRSAVLGEDGSAEAWQAQLDKMNAYSVASTERSGELLSNLAEQDVNAIKTIYDDLGNERQSALASLELDEKKATDALVKYKQNEEKQAEQAKKKREQAQKARVEVVKDEYTAIISAIKAFYAEQETVINQSYLDGTLTDMQRTQALEQSSMDLMLSLSKARKMLLGEPDAADEWQTELDRMLNGMEFASDRSRVLWEHISKSNLSSLARSLKGLGQAEMDGVLKNLEENEKAILERSVKIAQEIEKALLERDLTGKVRQEYGGSMQRLGLLSYLIPDGKTAKEAMNDVLEQMLSVYDSGALFEITDENFGEAMTEILASFTGISDEMRNMDDTRLRLLLDYMIRFGNATDEARKKLETMRHNTLLQNWDRSALGQSLAQRARNDEREGTFIGQLAGLVGGNNVVQSQGVRSAANEVDAIAQKIAMMRAQGDAEAELIKLTDELEAAENKLTQALIENVKDQADVIRELGGVLETAADEWGEYLGTTYETEEDAANARREIWNSMVDSAGGAIEKILKQLVTETITTAMLNQAKLEQQRQANIQMEAEQARHTATMISTEATELTAIGAAETGKASAKAIGTYGLKGVAIAALASAIIGGFIKFAMAKLKKPAIETSSKIATNAANQRLVSTMLTYDAGNVQALGSDGHLYSATPVGALQTGLYTSPVATTVNGQPALVAEKGPEFVIGRETTAAIQRNDPALLRALMVYDRHYSGRGLRTFDAGNVGSMDIAYGGATEAQLAAAVAQLNAILARGIKADINMYGESGLRNRLRQADKFMRGK